MSYDLDELRWRILNGAIHEIAVYSGDATPSDGQVILRYTFARAVTWPASLTGSVATANAASTGNVSCSVTKNGAAVAMVTFNGSATGTFTAADAVTWAAGDVLRVIAPASADATLSGISITFAGTR